MSFKKFLQHFNGWLLFAVASVLFFAVPPLYRIIDPTAGQFDAGYIHPIIYGAVVISFFIGFSWLALKLLAPGVHSELDRYLEDPVKNQMGDASFTGLVIFLAFVISGVVIICCMV